MKKLIYVVGAIVFGTILAVLAFSAINRNDSRLNDLCYDTVSQTAYQPESDGTCPR